MGRQDSRFSQPQVFESADVQLAFDYAIARTGLAEAKVEASVARLRGLLR
jgi:hypothetical protein